jgi:hypothetical protein
MLRHTCTCTCTCCIRAHVHVHVPESLYCSASLDLHTVCTSSALVRYNMRMYRRTGGQRGPVPRHRRATCVQQPQHVVSFLQRSLVDTPVEKAQRGRGEEAARRKVEDGKTDGGNTSYVRDTRRRLVRLTSSMLAPSLRGCTMSLMTLSSCSRRATSLCTDRRCLPRRQRHQTFTSSSLRMPLLGGASCSTWHACASIHTTSRLLRCLSMSSPVLLCVAAPYGGTLVVRASLRLMAGRWSVSRRCA